MNETNLFEPFLQKFNERDWQATLTTLLPETHEIDRHAAQIWFKFYPLGLHRVLAGFETEAERAKFIKSCVIQGNYELKNQIDTSHIFLYGHRFWSEAKTAVESRVESFTVENSETGDLAEEIRAIAKSVAAKVNEDVSLTVGISAVAFMTLVQVGLKDFKKAPGLIQLNRKAINRKPEQILAERAKDDSQGIFGFLKTVNKDWTITYDENKNAKFKAINDEEVTSASARDQSQKWREQDARCIEGVIPVECRSAACGTCWVGVLGGAEKLSDVSSREAKSMKRFGYLYSDEPKPIIRLACQAKTTGAVSIVIPPWNGVFGKHLYKELVPVSELEPATTSAVELRKALAQATTQTEEK